MKLFSVTRDLVGKPYCLSSPELGFDCFSLVVEYMRKSGVQVPETYKGRSTIDYGAFFSKDPEKAKTMMVEFVAELLEEVPSAFAFAGDILLARTKGSKNYTQSFLAIHGGNGHMMVSAIEQGVTLLPIRVYDISRAFRVRVK